MHFFSYIFKFLNILQIFNCILIETFLRCFLAHVHTSLKRVNFWRTINVVVQGWRTFFVRCVKIFKIKFSKLITWHNIKQSVNMLLHEFIGLFLAVICIFFPVIFLWLWSNIKYLTDYCHKTHINEIFVAVFWMTKILYLTPEGSLTILLFKLFIVKFICENNCLQ